MRRGALALAGVALLVAAYAIGVEPRRLVTVHDALRPTGWPAGLHLRVAVLSDLHIGAPGITLAKVDEVVAAVKAEAPDLVLILGDFAINHVLGGAPVAPADWAPRLKGLPAPAFAVLGNHDWWNDAVAIRAALEGAGVGVLENAAQPLTTPAGPLYLVGIGDELTAHHDIQKALAAVPAGVPILAFTHGPDLFSEVPARVGLTLAGHTHGGQVRLPGLSPWVVPSRYGARYARGLVVEEGRQLYVTSGVGTSILPLRLGVPPELLILELGD